VIDAAHCVAVDSAPTPDIDAVRTQLRTVLRDVNDLVEVIETSGLPDGTHALATALRQRLDDLAGAVDKILQPAGAATPRRATSNDPSPPVDEAALIALLDDLGDVGRVAYLVQLFLAELHSRRLALTSAVDQQDLAAAKAVAHTLKSSALLLGAAPLGAACDHLLNADQVSNLRPLVDDVMHQATASARWFQIWLANQPS
jgi:HPt (histidine-containing phosphotransfer) domain-containing protein